MESPVLDGGSDAMAACKGARRWLTTDDRAPSPDLDLNPMPDSELNPVPDLDSDLNPDSDPDIEGQMAGADHDGVEKDTAIENGGGNHRNELLETSAANFYAAKKTVAQGMMDIALITSNANQMRYLLEFGSPNPIYYFNLTLVIISLILQIAVGTALIFKGRADLQEEPKSSKKDKRLDDAIVVGVFLITIINVFMAAFAIGNSGAPLLEGAQTANLTNVEEKSLLPDDLTTPADAAATELKRNVDGHS